jgi:23S rRNA pseudouridine955/2504/2580 synthase
MVTIPITANEAGSRLDRLLRKKFPLKTLSDIYRMIRTGFVRVNGKKAKENLRLVEGDTLEVRIDKAELSVKTPAEGAGAARADLSKTDFYRRNLKIVYEDDAILALDKPPFLVVHPGTNHVSGATLIDLVKCYMQTKKHQDADADPVLVHRLDRDTSGIILVAKNKGIVRRLHEHLREHEMTKQYVAVCHGKPGKEKGVIEVNLAKTLEQNAGTKMSVDERGVFSKTDYSVIASTASLSKMQLTLFTGRTHQIRVHMAHIGCPVVGDVRYGDPGRDAELFSRKGINRRLYLHAALLSFVHPVTGKKTTLTVPEPEEFSTIMKKGHS